MFRKRISPHRLVAVTTLLAVLLAAVLAPGAALAKPKEQCFVDWNEHRPRAGGPGDWVYDNKAALDEAKAALRWELVRGVPVAWKDPETGQVSRQLEWRPGGTVTRAEFATMLCRALGEDPGAGKAEWWAPYTKVLGEKGILDPAQGKWSGPGAEITRREMAAWIGRAARAAKADVTVPEERFRDPYWFRDLDPAWPDYADILLAARCGAVKGRSAEVFDPDANATRVEAALMLVRLCRAMNQGKPDVAALQEITDKSGEIQFQIDTAWDPKARPQGPDYSSVAPWMTEDARMLYLDGIMRDYWMRQRAHVPWEVFRTEATLAVEPVEMHGTVALVAYKARGRWYRDGKPVPLEVGPNVEQTYTQDVYYVLRGGKWLEASGVATTGLPSERQ